MMTFSHGSEGLHRLLCCVRRDTKSGKVTQSKSQDSDNDRNDRRSRSEGRLRATAGVHDSDDSDGDSEDETSGSASFGKEKEYMSSPKSEQLWILMQLRDAGDMAKEIRRYTAGYIREQGCRYYMSQILAGLDYMHGKGIFHDSGHSLQFSLHEKGFRCHQFMIQKYETMAEARTRSVFLTICCLKMDSGPEVSFLPVDRREIPIPPEGWRPSNVKMFKMSGNRDAEGRNFAMPVFSSVREGLESFGLSEWSDNLAAVLGTGQYGGVSLVYQKAKPGTQASEPRHLAALKVQRLSNRLIMYHWTELMVMKMVKHDHIIDFYGAFVVTPPDELARAEAERLGLPKTPIMDDLCLLMQHADAGNMEKEISRYSAGYISEAGCRYYMKQMCAGMAYLHKRCVAHRDLHTANILLRFNRDGRTKTCMLCDFGLSAFVRTGQTYAFVQEFREDVYSLVRTLNIMMTGVSGPNPPVHPAPISASAQALFAMQRRVPSRVHQLMKHQWFTAGIPSAPVPDRSRTPPLVAPDVVDPSAAGTSRTRGRSPLAAAAGVAPVHGTGRGWSPRRQSGGALMNLLDDLSPVKVTLKSASPLAGPSGIATHYGPGRGLSPAAAGRVFASSSRGLSPVEADQEAHRLPGGKAAVVVAPTASPTSRSPSPMAHEFDTFFMGREPSNPPAAPNASHEQQRRHDEETEDIGKRYWTGTGRGSNKK